MIDDNGNIRGSAVFIMCDASQDLCTGPRVTRHTGQSA